MFEERNLIPSSQSVDVMVRHFVYRRKYIRAFNIVMEALDYADGEGVLPHSKIVMTLLLALCPSLKKYWECSLFCCVLWGGLRIAPP